MAFIPSNIKQWSKNKGISSTVSKVARWVETATGHSVSGGTAIGKYYSTLILDIRYQGSEIYIDCDDNTVKLFDEPVANLKEFQRVWNEKHNPAQYA